MTASFRKQTRDYPFVAMAAGISARDDIKEFYLGLNNSEASQ